MPRQFKLRLGDGTVLAVDHDGLSTWLIDDKAMVQPAGSRRWHPLKVVLARAAAAARAESARAEAAARQKVETPIVEPEPAPRAVLAPLAEPTAPQKTKVEADLPIIPFKPLDPPAPAPRAVLAPLAEPIAPQKAKVQDDLPIIPFKPLEDEVLEELDVLEEDEVAPKASKAQALLGAVSTWASRLTPREPEAPPPASPRREEPLPAWVASDVRPEPLKPPPAITELPTLRFAALPKAGPRGDIYDAGRWRLWLKRVVLTAGLAAAGVAAVTTGPAWMPHLEKLGPALFTTIDEHTRRLPPSPAATAAQPLSLPKELEAAAAQLPHLSADTVRLLASTSDSGVMEAPELFRLSYAAAKRGTSALSPQEARELKALEGAVLAALRPGERARVRAYDRISAGRELLTSEDGKVLVLFTRGVRALPPARRERLQALFAKAIAALPAPAPR
jgi:hypothetical protein